MIRYFSFSIQPNFGILNSILGLGYQAGFFTSLQEYHLQLFTEKENIVDGRRIFLGNWISFLVPEMAHHLWRKLELKKIYSEHWQFSEDCYSTEKYLTSRQGLWPHALSPKQAVWLPGTQITFHPVTAYALEVTACLQWDMWPLGAA